MKCFECGAKMEVRRENVKDKLIGLPYITLVGIEIRHCPKCGDTEAVIPRIEELHRVIAETIIKKTSRLTGDEVRFLRKCLGWSGTDFSRHFGIQRETVSRWENEREKMGPVAERLLRLAVAYWAPVEEYPVEKLDEVVQGAHKPLRLEMKAVKGGWKTKVA